MFKLFYLILQIDYFFVFHFNLKPESHQLLREVRLSIFELILSGSAGFPEVLRLFKVTEIDHTPFGVWFEEVKVLVLLPTFSLTSAPFILELQFVVLVHQGSHLGIKLWDNIFHLFSFLIERFYFSFSLYFYLCHFVYHIPQEVLIFLALSFLVVDTPPMALVLFEFPLLEIGLILVFL